MKIKQLVALGIVCVTCLTGCAGDEEINNLNNISALGSESNVNSNSYKLSYTDQQQLVYAQVSNRTLLDLSTLSACSEAELLQVNQYMNGVDDQLVGNTPPAVITSVFDDLEGNISEGNINSQFTDYLLAEFEKTPYYWQRTQMSVRGVDAESRAIVVDVTYRTIDFEKTVKPNSSIIQGSTAYETLEKNRYLKYLEILSTCKTNNMSVNQLRRYSGTETSILEAKKSLETWISIYGEPSKVYEEQSNLGLTEFIYATGNQKTYNGLIDSKAEDSKGTMIVRYVLVPKYAMGINLGLKCKHLYVLDYKLDDDITEGLEVFKAEGYATVTDNIYELIYSYFKCIDESDFNGLYKLTTDFSGLDKYYADMFNTSYRKHNNFTISLFSIEGTHITCGVSISSKIRAQGSNITMPIYTDRYFVEIDLVGDVLKITDITLLSRTIEGEPAITTQDAGTTGFSKEIDLKKSDKQAIEKLICDFSLYQLKGDTVSTGLEEIIDYSISTKDMTTLKENMTSLNGKNKVVHLSNYMQGTKSYATVKCKEQFETTSGIIEATVTYDMIVKGNKWYIIGYNVLSSVKLNSTTLQTSGSLCLVSQNKIESYTSQVTGAGSVDLDDKKDVSKVYEYKSYIPTLRNGNTSTTVSLESMTADMFKYADDDYETRVSAVNALANSGKSEYTADTILMYQTTLCFIYNVKKDNIPAEQVSERKESIMDSLNSALNVLVGDDDYKTCREVIQASIDLLGGI